MFVIIVFLEIFVGHLSDRIKYCVSQNEIFAGFDRQTGTFHEDWYYHSSDNKGADLTAVTAQLICTFDATHTLETLH